MSWCGECGKGPGGIEQGVCQNCGNESVNGGEGDK